MPLCGLLLPLNEGDADTSGWSAAITLAVRAYEASAEACASAGTNGTRVGGACSTDAYVPGSMTLSLCRIRYRTSIKNSGSTCVACTARYSAV